MLTAFTALPLVELRQRDKSKIESILAYGDRLLVGLNTGTLRIYRVNEVNDEESDEAPQTPANEVRDDTQNASASGPTTPTTPKMKPTDLLREQEKFARYKIEQLAIIKEANVLISLSNYYVSIHDLQTYELHEQLVRTKGATTFAVTSNIVKDPATGVPSIVSRLAVAVKRKLMLWTWQDMELLDDITEITLISGIKTITWAAGTKLVAGLSSSYVMVDVESKEVTDIVGPGSIGGPGGRETGGLGMASMSYIGMGGMVPKPLATRLSEGQMLLAKDVNTHFIDTDGNPLGRRQIPWNTAPEAVGYSYPYLLALQDASKGILEVRNPETLSLLQSISLPSATLLHIPQPNISLAHAGKGFLVASERVIWRMNALDYDSQIDALLEQGCLDQAISLLEMLEDALLTDKKRRLREVKLQKAQVLFDQQKYRNSLDLFTEVSAPPEIVIRLYPKLIAGELSSLEEEQQEDEEEEEEPYDSQGEQSKGNNSNGSDSPVSDDKGKNKNVSYTPSMRSLLRTKTDNSSETSSTYDKTVDNKESNKPLGMSTLFGYPLRMSNTNTTTEGKDLKTAVIELRGFLADIRRRLQRFLNPDGSLKVTSLHSNGEADDVTESVMHILGLTSKDLDEVDLGQKLRDTARLVDTTLFRALMYAAPSLAGSLFRIDNFCDPDVVMEKLEETGRYNDLIDFLFGKRLHRPALERLRKFGQAEKEEETAPQLHGPKRTIAYLQNLPPEMIDLILEFAEWPLRVDPELGMEVFLADTENAETLPRERVLEFLQSISAKLAIRYSEHVIEELNDMTPDLHQKLLQLYLEQLIKAKNNSAEFEDEEARERCRDKLLNMLETSTQYSPARMLDRLPRDGKCGEPTDFFPLSQSLRPRLIKFLDPDFYEARAITFSKMGQHRQTLEIYVFKLNDPQKAEE